MTLEDVTALQGSLLREAQLEALVAGNLRQSEAAALVKVYGTIYVYIYDVSIYIYIYIYIYMYVYIYNYIYMYLGRRS